MDKIAMKLAAMNSAVASEDEYDKYAALKMPNNKFTKVVRRVPRSINNYFGRLTGRNIKKIDNFYNRYISSYADQSRKMVDQLNDISRRRMVAKKKGDMVLYNKLNQEYYNLNQSLRKRSSRIDYLNLRKYDYIRQQREKNTTAQAITAPLAGAGLAGATYGLSSISTNPSGKYKANKNNKKARR